jgi:hypothetical protein
VLLPRQQAKLARGAKDKEHAMSQTPNTAIAVIGIDIGKNLFTHRPTRGAQKSYATQLADMLGCKVIELSE